jgi:hypothetical protein
MTVDLLTKEGRQKCWDAKDIYWKCLDENKGDIEKCKQSRDNYESNCSKSWVCCLFIFSFKRKKLKNIFFFKIRLNILIEEKII